MKKKGHRLFIFIACIIFVSLCTAVFTYRVSGNESRNRIQEELAQYIIRFHVRANSDSDEDQKRKLAVKDAVVEYLEAGVEFFVPSAQDMLNDGFLGLSVTALALTVWVIYLLIKDPLHTIRGRNSKNNGV